MQKSQFIKNQFNFVLRRFLLIRPHGIKWRSNGFMSKAFAKFEGIRSLARRGRAREPRGDGRERRGPRIGKSLGFETYIKRLSFINRAGFISSVALFIISLLIIFPIYYKTNLAEAAGSLSDTTLSITSDNLTAGVDLLVTSDSGTFASSTSPMTFNVTTNNVTGYQLSISAKSGTDLTNATAGTSFTSLNTANGIDATTFDTTAYNNMWGFKPNYYKSAANTDKFYPSPTTSGVTLNKTESANTNADTYTIAIGARATYAQPAGTYSNTYILNAVGNYPKYSITYADNSGDSTVSGLPAAQPITESASTTIQLSTDEPTRTGYDFIGWCSVATTDSGTTCSGTTYIPGADYTISTLDTNTLTLYATWEKSMLAIQNLDPSECTSTATEVYDTRDNTVYNIQRLADGRCWLLDNLRLNTGSSKTLDYSNTNVPSDYKFSLPDSGDAYLYRSPYDATNTSYTNTGLNASMSEKTENIGDIEAKYGVYYNYCAASAKTYCAAYGEATGDAQSDICPAGWRMPSGGNNGEYATLRDKYSSDADFIQAFHLPGSGFYDNGSAHYAGWGWFWSSTNYDGYRMYDMTHTSHINTEIQDRPLGASVRCVMKSDIEKQEYLQDITSDMVNAMSIGNTTTLKDSRDDTTYTVGKLADGNLWLLDNLAFDAYTHRDKITTQNTNIDDASLISLKSGNRSAGDQYAPAGITNEWGSDWYYNPAMVAISGKCNRENECANDPSSGTWQSTSKVNWAAGIESINGETGGKIGAYYNYCAATAGSYCFGDSTSAGNTTGSAMHDICPAGWRLPSGGLNGEYREIYESYNSDPVTFVTALRLPVSGQKGGDYAMHQQVSAGFFWSSTRAHDAFAYDMTASPSSINVANWNNFNRNLGRSVRCVFGTKTYMQDITNDDIANIPDGKILKLHDRRDDKLYKVVKLTGTDGVSRLWMTQNLAYTANTRNASTINASAIDSNFSSDFSISYGNSTYSYDTPYYYLTYSSTDTYGVYYNYAAASGGTITGDSNSSNAKQDICPAGWHLPTKDDFTNNYSAITSSGTFDNVRAGDYYNNNFRFENQFGHYWTSSYGDSTEMYRFYYGSTSEYGVKYNYGRGVLMSVRCIYEPKEYMQKATAANLATKLPNSGDTTILYDSRDNNSYEITNIAGTYWMTQSLNFTGTTLTAADSNVSSIYTTTSPKTISYYDLTADAQCNARTNYTDSMTYPCMQAGTDSGDNEVVFYNYAAASAGSITGETNSNKATESICPAHWRLPTSEETPLATNNIDLFKFEHGGLYYYGYKNYTWFGGWWTSDDSAEVTGTCKTTSSCRYTLSYRTDYNPPRYYSGTEDKTERDNGMFVRCIFDTSD